MPCTVRSPASPTNVTPEMKVVAQEAFAPVASVLPYDNFEDALRAADATPYGLQASVFTKNLDRLFQAMRWLNFGGIIVNDTSTFRVDHMPYGGNRQSGIGREGVRAMVGRLRGAGADRVETRVDRSIDTPRLQRFVGWLRVLTGEQKEENRAQ